MRIFFIFLFLPLKIFAQDIEGVWTGTIYNDTTRKYIPYEIAISKSKGKLSGYSHTVFLDNKKEVTGVKSLKIKQKNTKVLIEDDDLIYNNYSEPPPKGVKQYSVLNVMQGDSGLLLVGVFNTNRTKEYASLTGTIHLLKKEKINETKIIPKLDELKLSETLSFIQTKKESEQLAIAEMKKESMQSAMQKNQEEAVALLSRVHKEIATTNDDADAEAQTTMIEIKADTVTYKADVINDPDFSTGIKIKKEHEVVVKVTPPVIKKPLPNPASSIKKQIVSVPESVRKQIIAASQKQATPVKKEMVFTKDEKKSTSALQQKEKVMIVSAKPVNKTPVLINEPVVKPKENIPQAQIIKKPETVNPQPQIKAPVIAVAQKPLQSSIAASAISITSEKIAARKIETIRTVNFKSDSLTLTLYDNGVVDGDTVTVILNGIVIMPKQGLSTKAITKTIYVTPELGDSLQLIMYAENLGSIPPNTGLLIIQDGEDRYQIRFAGDLQKNSAIILKRNKSVSQ